MKMKNRLAAVFLCVLLVLSNTAHATALVPVASSFDTTVQELLAPRFNHLSRISSSLSISSAGRANCTGSFTTYDDYDSTMTVTLQQYVDYSWTDVKEWSEDYTGSGVKMLDNGYYVTSGYRYRVVTTVQIWDGDEEIEKVSCDSPIKDY